MPKDSVRRVQFSTTAAKQYFDLLNSQPRLESKVDALIDSILQNPESGIGKPDTLIVGIFKRKLLVLPTKLPTVLNLLNT